MRVTVPDPFDFALTVAKPAGWHWSTPAETFEDGVLWTGVRFAGRPFGLKLSSPSGNGVTAVLYADAPISEADKRQVRGLLEFGLGKHLDMKSFYRFARKDPVLAKTVRDRYGMRIGRLDELFGRVILAITLQMAQISRSRKMMADIIDIYGTRIAFEGHEVTLWPEPPTVAKVPEQELRTKANMGYRGRLLSAAARYLQHNPMSIRDLDALPDEEAVRMIRQIPGIGQYSAGIVMTRYVPIDAWSVIVMSELLLGKTPEVPRAEIETINSLVAERWGKWSWMAFAYILNDLDNLANDYDLTRLI